MTIFKKWWNKKIRPEDNQTRDLCKEAWKRSRINTLKWVLFQMHSGECFPEDVDFLIEQEIEQELDRLKK